MYIEQKVASMQERIEIQNGLIKGISTRLMDHEANIKRLTERIKELEDEESIIAREHNGILEHRHPDHNYWHPSEYVHTKEYNSFCLSCNVVGTENCLMLTSYGCRKMKEYLRSEIRELVIKYRGDFKDQIDTLTNIFKINEYSPYLKDYINKNYIKTGLACSIDISTGLDYNKHMRKRISKLISEHGKETVLLIVCEEYKKLEEGCTDKYNRIIF